VVDVALRNFGVRRLVIRGLAGVEAGAFTASFRAIWSRPQLN